MNHDEFNEKWENVSDEDVRKWLDAAVLLRRQGDRHGGRIRRLSSFDERDYKEPRA